MWERWAPVRYRADFARIAGLNANTVRIIVPVDLFGFPVPRELYTGRLGELVDIAAAQGLRVQLTYQALDQGVTRGRGDGRCARLIEYTHTNKGVECPS